MSVVKFQQRLVGGGNQIQWRPQDLERLAAHYDHKGPVPPLVAKRDVAPMMMTFPEVETRTEGSMLVYIFTISTGATDLALDQIAVREWDLSVFKANPIVNFAHDTTVLPIGRALWTVLQGDRLKAGMVFSSDSFAQRVRRGVDERVIRGASVGFNPGEWEFSRDPKRQGGINFTRGHVLLEWSVVGIPCNSQCLFERTEDAKAAAAPIEQVQVPRAATPFLDEARRRLAERQRVWAESREAIGGTSPADEVLDSMKSRLARIKRRGRVTK